MIILCAKYANPDKSVANTTTDISGEVFVPLTGEDFSGGWQPVLWAWMVNNRIADYEEAPE
jgi:hypothetical protein